MLILNIEKMNIRNINLNALPVFEALMRHGSVTLAARELNMSQPAVSSALAKLRLDLGDVLFVRSGKGLLPTPRAESLREPITDMMKTIMNKVLVQSAFSPAQSDRVFAICHSDVGSYVLWPKIVNAVLQQAPQVRLQLRILPQEQIASALENSTIDVAIGAFPKLPSSLFQKRLFDRQYVALIRQGHPLANKPLTMQNFARTPQLIVRQASGIQDQIDEILFKRDLLRTRVIEMPSYLMLLPMLESSDHLAVMPGQLADAFQEKGHFQSLKLPFSLSPSVIKLHWHRRVHEEPANIWLRSLITQLFSAARSL
jgi:DNA-binding transcriptional LysR family regulator